MLIALALLILVAILVAIELAVTLIKTDEDPNHENGFEDSTGYMPDHYRVGGLDDLSSLGRAG